MKNIPIIMLALAGFMAFCTCQAGTTDAQQDFLSPPDSARLRTLWMWMGCNVNEEAITRELEAMKEAGLSGTTMFSLSDTCTPWAGQIGNSPTPQIVAFSEPWWKLVQHAASESKRLGLEFGMHNCPGYTSSGGPWITPELSMQELIYSQTPMKGPVKFSGTLEKAKPDLHAVQQFPVFNPKTGQVEKPIVPARGEFYRDIAVLALPAEGVVPKEKVYNLTAQMTQDGRLEWDVPQGNWIIYRFGHTTMGTLIQPSQWEAIGLECDKINPQAVEFHMNYVLGEIKRHLGNLVGTTSFTHLHFDSYEAGEPTWTPKMPEEFKSRRGYDLIEWLPVMAARQIDSQDRTDRFRNDFKQTIRDMYRDIYYPTISRMTRQAGLQLSVEPYGGPWSITDVTPYVDRVMTEFWTHGGKFGPYELAPTVDAAWKAGQRIIEAEAFTGAPADSRWTEYPGWFKPIGDAAFCAGVNRICFHRWAHDPWDDTIRPGMSMGQWGSHFGRKQTWWKPGQAWLIYLQRCQALLQRGLPVRWDVNDFENRIIDGNPQIQYIHRRDGQTEIYFIANITGNGTVSCSFAVSGKQPELWDPVWGTLRDLPEYEIVNGKTVLPLMFQPGQSFFIVFRKPGNPTTASDKNFPELKKLAQINGPWIVTFDPKWGGPQQATFETLEDWTKRPEPGIKYYSGTAIYHTKFDAPAKTNCLFLDLGQVKHLACVRLNGKNLGILWTAPWRVTINGILKDKDNQLEIEVTNVWANRLIGDQQEPQDCQWLPGHQDHGGFLKAFPDWFINNQPRPSKGRYCFTTWNYFDKNSPLIPSGLTGPVTLQGK